MKAKREVYHSTTHGPISLSFEGRRLMANLRLAVETYGKECRANMPFKNPNWEPVARARGDIAAYISKLEELKRYPPDEFTATLEVVAAPEGSHIHLPPIPPGYELTIVGPMVRIAPVDRRL